MTDIPLTVINNKPRLLTTPTPGRLAMGPCDVVGVSLAGVRTALYIPELKVSFDAGFPFPFQLGSDVFFITHGHLDHASAIPYIISQKNLNSQKTPTFYMPEALVEPLSQIIRLWQSIETHDYPFRFVALKPNEPVHLNNQFFVKAFKAHHRIPANGYTLFQRKKQLKFKYLGLSKEALVDLKSKGTQVDDIIDTPLMAFSGDSKIEYLWEYDWILQSKYLLIETTYLDSRKTVEKAREWGHIHLDELIEILPKITSEKIVLMHISSRYGDEEAQRIVKSKIPAEYADRVMIFEGR